MRCPIRSETTEILLDYCARRLDGEREAPLERHLAICEECRLFTDAQRSLWMELDDWEAAPVSRNFDQRVYARIQAGGAPTPAARWLRRVFENWDFSSMRWRPAASFGTVAVTVAAAVILMNPTGDPKPRIETGDLEQVERTLEDLDMLKQLSAPNG